MVILYENLELHHGEHLSFAYLLELCMNKTQKGNREGREGWLLPWDGLGSVPAKTCASSLRAENEQGMWVGWAEVQGSSRTTRSLVGEGTGRGTKAVGKGRLMGLDLTSRHISVITPKYQLVFTLSVLLMADGRVYTSTRSVCTE